ncbi:MAG: HD domain-containing protein [Treponema sp.]|jgi:metal-dependent HD superfamily phosphatase/phosphodiesterase|nr:HD domain-containing protein [Treponema sp.]
MKSSKELNIDSKLIDMVNALGLSGKAVTALETLLADDEIQAAQEYANTVSIVRLGFNDHGPVHMRTVTQTSILMLELLQKAGIKTSLESDGCGDFEDSLIAVILAAFLHDLGMGMGRHNHELHSTIMAQPVIDKLLEKIYKDDLHKRVMIRAAAMEGIAGHMGTISISSIEAGIVQVADGCDMTKGRARIQISMAHVPQKTGYIHQYSANSIEEVNIGAGEEKPIRVNVHMSSEVGLFQVEEVLLHKIANSTAKQYIELYTKVDGEEVKRYL